MIKFLTMAAAVVALIGLSACASKKESSGSSSSMQHRSSTGYSK